MNMNPIVKSRPLFIVLFLTLSLFVQAQKIRTVSNASDPYIFFVPDNMSQAEARQVAVQRAQIDLLAKEFGTTISQSTTSYVNVQGDETSKSFTVLGTTDVKGEWIETIGEPEIERSFENGQFILTVRIKGKAREIIRAKTLFQTKVLRNDPLSSVESTDFKDGDKFFLSFETPASGYLAVYLVDASQTASCLLPYRSSKTGNVSVQANTDYIFFSEGHAKPLFDARDVDPYELYCDGQSETDYLYIIFSPNPFIKAADAATATSSDGYDLPRTLSATEFRKWLSTNLTKDTQMQQEVKTIKITR